jgi:Holliday junction resolvase RusA-like endonuclease
VNDSPQPLKIFYKVNCALSGPKSKRSFRHEPLAASKRKKENPRCRVLKLTSYRRRLLDTDNLRPKYFIDALRYAGVIDDDTPKHLTLQTHQEKVSHRCEEKTLIELEITNG